LAKKVKILSDHLLLGVDRPAFIRDPLDDDFSGGQTGTLKFQTLSAS